MTDCPGSCNTWWRNLTQDEQETAETGPRPGDPVWCHPCAARIRRQLTELDYLGALLAAVSDGYREPPAGPGPRGATAPSPSDITDTITDYTEILLTWEDSYRKERRLPAGIRHGYLADVRSEVIAYLAERLDTALALNMAEAFGQEVFEWHRKLAARAKAGTGQHRKPVPCPRCGLKLLSWREGDDYVQCAGCNRHLSMADYHAELSGVIERAG